MKHVSGAQLTGTRAGGEERCQAASRVAGGFALPGNPPPAPRAAGRRGRWWLRASRSAARRPRAPTPAAAERPGPGAPEQARGEPPSGSALPPGRAALARFTIAPRGEPFAWWVCRTSGSRTHTSSVSRPPRPLALRSGQRSNKDAAAPLTPKKLR